MQARRILALLRDGITPDTADLRWFAAGLADGTVSDAQAGAFAMAVVQRGLGEAGRVALTCAMRDTGRVLDWALGRPVVDKHSTGGIGDATSLLLAPALAACGAAVPMISGRGLGHTGGTLDKLEAIPGCQVDMDLERLRAQMAACGCAIVSASGDMAPADRRLYAVRDVTATVDSVDLITASILSKKLAAGLSGLVLDVKAGSGAFMKTPQAALGLARALVDTAKGAGCPTVALISDMSQPLADAAGNAVEVAVVIDTLTGRAVNARLWQAVLALGGQALVLAGLAADAQAGAGQIEAVLRSGAAAEVFGRMIAAQGGPADVITRPGHHLPRAPVIRAVPAPRAGYVAAIEGQALGQAVVALGGGRAREGAAVDRRVGFSQLLQLGAQVTAGAALGLVHAADEGAAARASAALVAAYDLAEAPPAALPGLILDRVA